MNIRTASFKGVLDQELSRVTDFRSRSVKVRAAGFCDALELELELDGPSP
jgi:hypothetical protein